MIRVRDVNKSYASAGEVLKGVSLDIARGGHAVILGASGSGKSTLLSIMSGLEKADGGSVTVDGVELVGLTDKQLTEFRRKTVGFVFQQYYLLEHLTVDGNVRLGADLAGNKNYREIIEAVGLIDKLKSKPSELSGGEQQRVCIARALAKNPRVLYMDEPTGALDENTGRAVLDYIERLQRELKFTAVTVTHNANIADTADTVIKLNSGRIVDIIVDIIENSAPKTAYEIGW